ncbi:MAG: hypothetical protein IJE81_03965 [Oscillospiraceae bacterium]|nr:hypothetical protein [Oscillospiraceae bacterium]MBQ7129541.1 hypothetical protein [Oscillospiraceae bacterium]
MYNRYVPQSDGTYQRRRVPETIPPPRPAPASAAPEAVPYPVPEPPKHPVPPRRPRPGRPRQEPESIASFLRQLLPRDFDTGDLLVVVLLLLMSGNDREDQNTALLTLALYLFM